MAVRASSRRRPWSARTVGAGTRRIGQPREGRVERRGRLAAQRRVIDVETLDAPAPVILAAVELEDVEALLDEGDEGQKIFALQPVLVEIVGRVVGGGDDDDAVLEQGLEETAEQHGIGDVLDLELVEAEKADLLGDGPRQGRDGIAVRLAAPAMEGLMDLQHEGVEMHAALPGHRRAGEEHVHQHGLARADAAEDVEPLHRGLGPSGQAEALAPAAAPAIAGPPEGIVQRLQLLGGEELGRIGLQQPGRPLAR